MCCAVGVCVHMCVMCCVVGVCAHVCNVVCVHQYFYSYLINPSWRLQKLQQVFHLNSSCRFHILLP